MSFSKRKKVFKTVARVDEQQRSERVKDLHKVGALWEHKKKTERKEKRSKS